MRRAAFFLPGLFVLLAASMAGASPYLITSTLSGDGRPGNPDGLKIIVTIAGDTTSNVADWTVDLDMPVAHPGASLHEFYFNVVGSTSDYALSAFNPASWALTGTNIGAQGSGNANFMFEESGPNNTVTNGVNLTFVLTKLTGDFLVTDFTGAADSCSRDLALGCGQLGAHVGSLVAGAGESDSGFALGGYKLSSIPEPGTLALLGGGLAAVIARRRQVPRS